MLIEKDEKLEHSSAGVTWKEKGVAGGECRGHAV